MVAGYLWRPRYILSAPMSVDLSGEISAIATAALALFAVITAVFAFLAYRKQDKEVTDQAAMLKVQSEQLEEQRKINAEQTQVLALQASELAESLSERKREAEQRRRAQATQIFISQQHKPWSSFLIVTGSDNEGNPQWEMGGEPDHTRAEVAVVNTSDQPIYNTQLRWYRGSAGHGDPNPETLGTVMPGSKAGHTREFPLDTNMDDSGANLRFRDAAGIMWIRRLDGGLEEQQQSLQAGQRY
jgi:cbb3-type cytochrome oxidase subunit 3